MKKLTREQLVTAIERAILGKAGINGAVEAADAVLALLDEGEPAYPESFAEQPKSILEERANRARGGASVWTVRDALLAALRDVDSGANVPSGFVLDQAVIILVAAGPENDTAFRYYQRVKSRLEHVGILDTARHDSHADGRG